MTQSEGKSDESLSAREDAARVSAHLGARHRRVALVCVAAIAGMGALSYASVPLYRLFCQVTGFAGTTQRAAAPSNRSLERTITMRFDGNTSRKLEWDFGPVDKTIEVKLGENRIATYRATNTSDEPLWGTATFNVAPASAGAYFNKIECFCFTEQLLKPGETVDMPVSFFIDPAIVEDRDAAHLSQVTLSYTFFPLDKNDGGEKRVEANRRSAGANVEGG